MINFYKDNQGNWINDPKELLNHTKQFFMIAFSTSLVSSKWTVNINNPGSHNSINLACLDKPLTLSEITKVVFSFKPFKTPGPDGIHPFFYHKFRKIVGP